MGKAKDGSNCYTRQNKSGGSYVTCEGTQKSGKSAAQGARQAQPAKAKPKVDWNRSDTARGRARRAAAARKLKTRQAGRIETGPLNPGSVITDFDTSAFVAEAPGVVAMTSSMTPLGRVSSAKKSMTEGEKVLSALYPWQRNKGVVKSIERYEPPEYSSGPILSEDAVKKFNRLNNIPKNPKKYLVADIQGRKPNQFVGAQNEIMRVIDKEKREKNNIKVTFHQFDTWEKAIQYIDLLKKVNDEEKKKYEPLSKAQRERVAQMTAENGVAITPQNNNSFKYGFGFVGVCAWAHLKQDPTYAITSDDAPDFADINYKVKKKK